MNSVSESLVIKIMWALTVAVIFGEFKFNSINQSNKHLFQVAYNNIEYDY